jgi:succinate-semialdehyde dehydrogenase/glutarate-semialdehyde dehydrogenase
MMGKETQIIRTINPFNEEIIAEYTEHSEKQLITFIEHLNKGYKSWRSCSLQERLNFLPLLKRALLEEKENLAKLITDEMGKPITQSFAEVEKCMLLCDYYHENSAQFLVDMNVETSYSKSYYQYSPLGIILGIMPWNFALWQVMRFAIPNLVLGNSILLKHAPNTTGTSLAIEKLISKIFPNNIFKSIIVDIPIIAKILSHNLIAGVSITGSKKAGSSVAKHAGENIKKSVLELGGNDPFIVFDDADIEDAAHQCIESRLLNSGQVCVAAKRIILSQNIAIQFEGLLIESLKKISLGSPYLKSNKVGPLARTDIKQNLKLQVKQAIAAGAKSIFESKVPNNKGFFFPITVLKNVLPSNIAFQQELFGPVFCITEACNNKEAVELANQSEYGLSASIFSKNLEQAEKICQNELEFGMCSINKMVASNPQLPFGGIKSSGFGRELAEFGLKEFANIKTILIN